MVTESVQHDAIGSVLVLRMGMVSLEILYCSLSTTLVCLGQMSRVNTHYLHDSRADMTSTLRIRRCLLFSLLLARLRRITNRLHYDLVCRSLHTLLRSLVRLHQYQLPLPPASNFNAPCDRQGTSRLLCTLLTRSRQGMDGPCKLRSRRRSCGHTADGTSCKAVVRSFSRTSLRLSGSSDGSESARHRALSMLRTVDEWMNDAMRSDYLVD